MYNQKVTILLQDISTERYWYGSFSGPYQYRSVLTSCNNVVTFWLCIKEVYVMIHRRRVLFSPQGGGGGGVLGTYTDTGTLNWVGGGKHCKLHVFVHIYLLKVYMTT